MSQYISLLVSDETSAYLTDLSRTGLYGNDIHAVAEQLILAGLREAVGHMHLVAIRYQRDEFAEVEEAPPEHVPLKPKFTCAHCEDGDIMPKDAKGVNCPRCGTDCLPF